MEQWEYRAVKVEARGFFGGKVDLDELEDELNALGRQGWELTSTFETNMSQGASREVICLMKRRLG